MRSQTLVAEMGTKPIPVNAFGHHVLDAYVFEVEGSEDLDFVLCDPVRTAANERERVVDYSWLKVGTRPRFRPNDPLASRVRELVRWIENNYIMKCTRDLPEMLQAYSKTMSFEYDAYLRTIGTEDGRHVEGVVQPADKSVSIILSIPLLLDEASRVQRTLSTIVELYAKLLRVPLDTVPQFSHVEISLIIVFSAADRGAPVEVLSERITMHIDDSANITHGKSFASFISSCVTFRGMPQYSATLQSGAGFMDYIPTLNQELLLLLKEPLHFLEMVWAMSPAFGKPLDVNIATNDPDEGRKGEGALVRSAVFCVVDDTTQFSFCITLRYYNYWSLPSVGIIANQYTSSISQESPLRTKLKFPDNMRHIEKTSGSGELLDLLTVCDAIERLSFETMSFLISTCQ